MSKTKVFIDGREGTTGLQIEKRMSIRSDVVLLEIEEEKRKDIDRRRALLNEADVVFLCLPDSAAIEAAKAVENDKTIVIDASTAHRTDKLWDYGFPELGDSFRSAIASSRRIANPGCHATGFISVVYPLIFSGVLPKDSFLSCYSLTGYSGGGKKMIAEYEQSSRPAEYSAPRIYALGQAHKHLAEMMAVTSLNVPPAFCPVVCDFYSGMAVSVAFDSGMIGSYASIKKAEELYRDFYKNEKLITVEAKTDGMIAANEAAGKSGLKLYISGNTERIVVTAVFDNLCKGASGAAVQNMNIALGLNETYSITECF